MKRIALLAVTTLVAMSSLTAQQDPMFTKYFFNTLAYNPAYAGSADALSINLLHRNQWVGINGGPLTHTLSIHSPLRNDRIALGMNLVYDRIGASSHLAPMFSYVYRIPTQAKKATFNIGVQGGFDWYRADWNQLDIRDVSDPNFQVNPSYILPNFGLGLYYKAPKWFVGFSVPQLLNNDLRKEGQPYPNVPVAQQYRHMYLSGGLAIPLSTNVVFRPMALWKNVGLLNSTEIDGKNIAAPNEIDIDLSFLFNKTLWLGTAFRTAVEGSSSFDSVDFWAQFALKNGLRIGVAYDFALTKLQGPSGGSYELMLGYDFNYNKAKIVTPRYF